MKLEKLRLILDVDINPQGTEFAALRENILDVVRQAVNNGTLTNDTPATVERYNFKVIQRRNSYGKPIKKYHPKKRSVKRKLNSISRHYPADDAAEQQRRDEMTFMSLTQKREYNALTPEQKRIYDSVMESFPATHHASAYDVAIQGGIRFQFIFK